MFNIDAEEIKNIMCKAYQFLELDWKPPIKDAEWHDGTEFIGALKLSGGQWEFHTLTISCDGDLFDLEDQNGEHFDAWELEDFDYIAIQSGGYFLDHGEDNYVEGRPASLHIQ